MRGDHKKEQQDWLSGWDKWATTAEPFPDWVGVPYFFLLRYRILRPQSRYRLLRVVLASARNMARRLRPLCVLKNLKPRQGLQLGALAFDFDADYQFHVEQAARHVKRTAGAKQALGSVARLNQELQNAASALDELAGYLEELHKRWPISVAALCRRTPSPTIPRGHAHWYRSMITADDEMSLRQQSLDNLAQPLPGFKNRRDINPARPRSSCTASRC